MRKTLSISCLSTCVFFLTLPVNSQEYEGCYIIQNGQKVSLARLCPSEQNSLPTESSSFNPLPSEASQAPNSSTVLLTQVDLDESLYPGRDLPYSTAIDLGTYQSLVAVGILTDWWQKRPTQIRVYEFRNGQKGALIGDAQFPTYLENVCGFQFDRKCEVPDRQGSGTALLPVRINRATRTPTLVVEVDGLLSPENEYVILKAIAVYGSR